MVTPAAPAPAPQPAPLLPVLPTRRVLPKDPARQPCGVCPNQPVCWRTPQGAAVALAVCRIQSGIDVDQSTARLVEAAWPDLLKIGGRMVTRGSQEEAAMDLARELVEAAKDYRFGEAADPRWWLITGQKSAVRYAAKRLAHAHRSASRRFVHLDVWADVVEGEAPSDTHDEERAAVLGDRAMAIAEDGLTLSVEEYRVLMYLTDNGKGLGVRTGLHVELARRMGVARSHVTRIYYVAIARILHALGHTVAYFQKRGVRLPTWSHARRQLWAARVPRTGLIAPLTEEQRADVVVTLREVRLSEAEVAWAFGVGRRFVEQTNGRRKRMRGQS